LLFTTCCALSESSTSDFFSLSLHDALPIYGGDVRQPAHLPIALLAEPALADPLAGVANAYVQAQAGPEPVAAAELAAQVAGREGGGGQRADAFDLVQPPDCILQAGLLDPALQQPVDLGQRPVDAFEQAAADRAQLGHAGQALAQGGACLHDLGPAAQQALEAGIGHRRSLPGAQL